MASAAEQGGSCISRPISGQSRGHHWSLGASICGVFCLLHPLSLSRILEQHATSLIGLQVNPFTNPHPIKSFGFRNNILSFLIPTHSLPAPYIAFFQPPESTSLSSSAFIPHLPHAASRVTEVTRHIFAAQFPGFGDSVPPNESFGIGLAQLPCPSYKLKYESRHSQCTLRETGIRNSC